MSKTAEELIADARRRVAQYQSQTGGFLSSPQSGGGTLPPTPPTPSDYSDFDPGASVAKLTGGRGDGGASLASNIWSGVLGVGRGIASIPTFAGKAAQTAAGAVEGVVDIASEGVQAATGYDPYVSRLESDLATARAQGLGGWDQFLYAGHRQFPLVSDMARSFQGTGSRLAELGTGGALDFGAPGIDYATAYREGNLGAVLVEDLGNAILLGRGAGAGNVISRGGGLLEAAGKPRLGRVVSTTGRLIEEPVGTLTRGAARLGQASAEASGAVGLGSRLGRVAQAGLDDTPGPIRQLLTEATDVRQRRAVGALAELVAQYRALDEQLVSGQGDPGAINRELRIVRNQMESALLRTGLVSKARKKIVADQIFEEATRTNVTTEAARLKTLGPRAVFPDADPGPMPDYATPVVNLIRTGRMEFVLREAANGKSAAEIATIITPTGIGPDLERIGYRFTAEDVQKAIDYANGTIDKFGRQSIDATLQLFTRQGDKMTADMLSGKYRLGGPMPESYVDRYPVVEFLFAELDRGRFRRESTQLLAALDDATVQFLDTLPPKLRSMFKQDAMNPDGAFRALVEVPANSPLAGVAQRLLNLLYPQLLAQFPNVMRDALIYPAQLRPLVMAEGRALQVARAQDIATIVRSMNDLADTYGNLLGSKFVESIRNDLDTLVDTPAAYLPGSYTRILNKITKLQGRIRDEIRRLSEQEVERTAQRVETINNLVDAEARLGAMQATIRTLVDNLNRIDDADIEGVSQALESLDLSEQQRKAAQDAITLYEREQVRAQLDLEGDARQTLIDEIDAAVKLAEQVEIADSIGALIDEFEFRRNEVEAGRPDPTTVEPKPYTNRSKNVKAFRDEMLRVAQDAVNVADSRLEQFVTGPTLSWNAWAVDTNVFGQPLREVMINELARYLSREEAEKVADGWAGGRYDTEGHVYPRDDLGIDNDRGYPASGIDDYIQEKGEGTSFGKERQSGASGTDKASLATEWQIYIRAMAEFYKATEEVKRIKKLRLYEIADEMNRDRSTRDYKTSGYSLPLLARTIAYLTNPNLLTADLRLRDQYAIDIETGVPYEGATPKLIPIPRELLDELRRADRDVTKQQRNVARLRTQGTAEQRRIVRGQLKGVGKIVEQPDGTVEGQMLKGPQTKAETEIQQLQNKDLYLQNKLDEIRQKYEQQVAVATDVRAARAGATAVETQMAQPFGPLLLTAESQVGYLPAGLPTTARTASRVATELQTEGAAPQVKSPTEQMRTSDIMPLRLDDMAKRFDEIMNVVGRNKVLEDVVMDPGNSIRMADLITAEQLTQMVEKAQREVTAQRLVRTPAAIEAEVRKAVGLELANIARRAGFEAISPVKVDPETGAHEALGDLLKTVPDEQVDPNTILMKFGMRERLTQEFVLQGSTNVPDYVMKVLDTSNKLTTGWKGTVLPFSLRWQVGDLVSNVLNAWARGDVPVGEMIRRMQEVDMILTSTGKRLDALGGSIENTLLSTLIGAGLQARGVRDFELQMSRGLNPRAQIGDLGIQGPIPGFRDTPGLRMFPGFREKSFRFNEYQNTVARAAMAMSLLEKTLAEKGRSIDEVTPYNYIDDPQIRDAVNNAVRRTNDALGAFTELSPFEKNVVRKIYPFWSWLRYINKAAVKMAVDNPDRVLFASALGTIVTSPEENGLFGFLEGRVPMLGYYFDLSFLNPYQDSILFSPNPIKAAADQLTNVSPGITLPVNAVSIPVYYATGRDIGLFGQRLQRPSYLEGRTGASTRGIGDMAGELGYLGLTTLGGPFRNILQLGPTGERIPGTDVALGNVQRFPQGSARTEGRYAVQRLSRPASILSAVLGTFGVPRPLMEQDVAEQQAILQTIADIEAQQRRERERVLSRIGQ